AHHAWAATGRGIAYGPDDFGSAATKQFLFIPDSVRPGAEITDCPWVKYMRVAFTDYIFSESLRPAVPENNFWIGEVVSWEYNGNTGPIIDTPNINFQWFKIDTRHQVYSRRPSSIYFQDVDQVLEMDWGVGPLEIYFDVLNNVGGKLILGKGPEIIIATITGGNGEISPGEGCGYFPRIYSEDSVNLGAFNNFDAPVEGSICRPSANLWKLLYKRDNEVTDVSPTIRLVFENESAVTLDFGIILYDVGGNPMT
ncbi:unnamed protein product, partial [marine sediment metagenome]